MPPESEDPEPPEFLEWTQSPGINPATPLNERQYPTPESLGSPAYPPGSPERENQGDGGNASEYQTEARDVPQMVRVRVLLKACRVPNALSYF